MEINSNLQIALRIAGTKQRRAGFAPLVTVGVLAGDEGANMYRSTIVAERPAYIVKHAPGYILYQLIDRGAKPFDADANGVLSIALTISSNAQMANGKSPYTLLSEVYRMFVDTYMEPTSDGRLSFIDTDNNNDIFREIVSRYRLEERKTTYIPMAQQGLTGVVCVPQEKLSDFFINTQYKEFASFKDIEVGISCHNQITPGLEQLQIPLPPASYEVWVNEINTGATMSSPADTYLASSPDTKFYTYESVEFSLSELLNAPNGQLIKKNSRIIIEPDRNRISCTLKRFDILYDLSVEWKEKDPGCRKAIEENAKEGKIRLMLDDQNITPILYSQDLLSLRASAIHGKAITINPWDKGGYDIHAFLRTDDIKHKIIVIMTVGKKDKVGDSGYSSPITGKTNRITNSDKTIDDPDYFKGGNRTEETPSQPNQKKGMIDLKSFGLGVVVGLLLGLAIWFLIGLIGGDEKKGSDKKVESKSEEAVYPAYAASNEQPDSSVEEKAGDIIEPIGEKKNNDVSLGDATPTPAKSETSSEKTGATGETENIANINVAKATIATMIKNGERKLDNIKKTDAYKQLKNGDRLIVSRIVDPKNGLGPNYKDYFEKSDLGLIKTMVNNAPISDWQDIVTLSQNIEETLKDIVRGKGGSIK